MTFDIRELATVQLQIDLNKRIYEKKAISYHVFSKANDLLQTKLSQLQNRDETLLDEHTCL